MNALLLLAATVHVTYATQQRLYLDAGSADGLAAGQVVQLKRNGRTAGKCTVEAVSRHNAMCVGSGAAGDVFDVSPPPRSAAQEVKRPPAPEPADTVRRKNALVVSAPFEKVSFAEEAGGPAIQRGEVSIAHSTWAASGAGPWHQERLDASIHDARLGGGFTLDVDLSARRYSLRSDPISFRPEDPTQLYVWEAAISRVPRDGGVSLSAGRVRTRFAPGQTILDGAQAGWRSEGGSEAGVFGGAVPDEVTLAPSLQHGTFGAYWGGEHKGDAGSVLRIFRHEARVAFVNTAALGKRIEGEGLVQLWLTRAFDASGELRLGFGDSKAPNSIDGARIDANLRAAESLLFTGGFRYDGLSIPELDGPANVTYGGAARHADVSAQWQPGSVLRIAVLSGLSTDLLYARTTRWIGPEVAALFGPDGALTLGYLEEDGWAKGRSGYLQLGVGQRSRLQLLARVSWFRTAAGAAPQDTDELGAFVSVRAQLWRALGLRVNAAGRTAVNGVPTASAGWLDAALDGQF